jgi:transposase
MKEKGRFSSDKVKVVKKHKTKSPEERQMNLIKYIGMDVHMAMTTIAVLDSMGRVFAEAIVQTRASAILDFIKSQRGTLHVAFEEGNQAAWLYDLLRPYVAKVVVCDPRKLPAHQGNKADKPDAKRIAELLRTNSLNPVYHGERSTREIKEFAQSYSALVKDSTRVKSRLKSLFRARSIDCRGSAVYNPDQRKCWLKQLRDKSVQARASRLWEELDCLEGLVERAKKDLTAEARKHAALKIFRGIPGIGPLRAAVIVGIAGTPHRFRTKRQFWAYCGQAIVTKASSEYVVVAGHIARSKKRPLVLGLNSNYNRALKAVFKGAAITAAKHKWKPYYDALIQKGMDPSIARVTLARKIAAITLAIWKKGERYDAKKINIRAAA